MPDPDEVIGYAQAADLYRQAGWVGVLPLKRNAKKWPPTIKCDAARAKEPSHPFDCPDCISYTGWHGIDPSYPDILSWAEQYPDGNLCLRLPRNDTITIVGIDIDDYGAKRGAATITEAQHRWGDLPPAPRSTSRDSPVSGIRLYRVPPGTVLQTHIGFPELGIGDIEICQFHHRYVISWPSIHNETLKPYWWRDDDNRIIGLPAPSTLEWLPDTWVENLRIDHRAPVLFDGTGFDINTVLTAGEPSTLVRERMHQAIKELNLPGQSRHDTCCRHVLAILRLGRSREAGVRRALDLLCEVFIAAVKVDGSRSPTAARGEFDRMIHNQNAARELSAPDPYEWVYLIESESPGQDEGAGAITGASQDDTRSADLQTNPPEIQGSRPRSHLEEIEQGFWDSRESLRMIYQTAMAMMASPWATLGVTAAKALTTVRPHVTLPPVISGRGSLNWFVALSAKSGGGKGAANGASRLLIPDHLFHDRNLGSGEGLTALFGRSSTDEDPDSVHEALLINVDEVDTLTALGQRSASTTMSVLRSAFMGETLGFSYVGKGKGRHIPAHSYRMTMVMSVQPERAGALFADKGGGTPQRFMWFPAKDSRISMDELWPSGELTLPHPSEWQYPREVAIPNETRYTLRLNRVKSQREEQDALDGHALFCREKFAYALAVIDGRVNMTLEDWELSGIAADISAHTRESALGELRDASHLEAVDRGEIRGVELDAAEVEREHQRIRRGERVLRWLLHKLDDAGPEGMAQTDLLRKITSRDRPVLQTILGSPSMLIRAESVGGAVIWFRT